MTDTCECTRRPGCGCSLCYAPDVTTELISGDPWEIGFANLSMLSGTVYLRGSGLSFTFTIYNGTEAAIPIYFDSNEAWPDGSVRIYDSDGQVVFPWDTMEPGSGEYTVVVDPANWTIPGLYTGDIVAGDNRKAIGITGTTETENQIAFLDHANLIYNITASLDEVARLFMIGRTAGTDNLYWKLSIEWDTALPGGSSVAIRNQAGAVTLNQVYGPLSGGNPEIFAMNLDPTGMDVTETYEGTLYLTGYTDAAGTEQTNVDSIKVQVLGGGTVLVLTFSDPVDRGTPFNVTVTATDIVSGNTVEDYEGGILNIGLLCDYDPVDLPTPTSVDSTGEWSSGVYTISGLVVVGNSGSDTAELIVQDEKTGIQGAEEIDIQSSVYPFAVVFSPDVTRGGAFNMVIQALDADGQRLTTYTPSGNVDINLTSDDVGDSVAPLLTDNTGWVDGRKTVSCTITGGSGSDHFEIECDDGGGRVGTCEGILDKVSLTQKAGTGRQWAETCTDNSGQPWTYSQEVVLANFLTVPDYWQSYSTPGSYAVSIIGTYQNAAYKSGYVSFPLTAGDKAGIKAAFIYIYWDSYYHAGTKEESENSGNIKIRLKYTESAASYANPLALSNMSPDQEVEPVRLDQFIHNGAGWPTAGEWVYIPVDPAVIAAVSGSILYVWMHFQVEDVIPVGASTATENHGLAVTATGTKLYIYK